MRLIPSLALMLVLIMTNASLVGAITLTATPNPAVIGQSTLLTVNATITSTPCPISVDVGEGPATTLTCTALGPCVGNFFHTYLSSGLYLASATGPIAASCTAGPDAALSLNVICPPLNIVTSALPGAIVGQPYSAQLTTTGGVVPVTWEVATLSPPLPAGLTLSPTGMISGTPTAYGQFSFNLAAEDNCAPTKQYVTKGYTINVATPATSELTITRLQLSFDNGRAETTVSRNQPGLQVKADIRFNGTGLLDGYWEVDGRLLARVNQLLNYGKSITLKTPAVPFLPTFVEGSHRVRLVITTPPNDITFPEAIYYVTAEESTAGLAPLRTTEPRNHAELAFTAQSFKWEAFDNAAVYLVEFFEKEDEDPVASAYTKDLVYALPESILTEGFSAGKAYFWSVKSYDAEGNLVGASELSRFIFQ